MNTIIQGESALVYLQGKTSFKRNFFRWKTKYFVTFPEKCHWCSYFFHWCYCIFKFFFKKYLQIQAYFFPSVIFSTMTFKKNKRGKVFTYFCRRLFAHYEKWVTEAVSQMCSVKKVVLEISQNSQKITCARISFLKKLQA